MVAVAHIRIPRLTSTVACSAGVVSVGLMTSCTELPTNHNGVSKPLLGVSDMRNNETEGEPEPCQYCGKPAVCVVFEHFSVCAACSDEIEGDRIYENAHREYDVMVLRWRSEC